MGARSMLPSVLGLIPYADNADTGRLDIAGKFIVSTPASV